MRIINILNSQPCAWDLANIITDLWTRKISIRAALERMVTGNGPPWPFVNISCNDTQQARYGQEEMASHKRSLTPINCEMERTTHVLHGRYLVAND